MKKRVEPPRPLTLLIFFSFIGFAVSAYILIPLLFGAASLVVTALEIANKGSGVSGDFNGVVMGDILWHVATWPFRHWIISPMVVVAVILIFVGFTALVNRK